MYLLLVLALCLPFIFDSKAGLHSGAAMLFAFAYLLTFPLSWIGFGILGTLSPPTNKLVEHFVAIGVIVVSAIFNAAVIYFLVSLVSIVSQKNGSVHQEADEINKIRGEKL